VCQYQWFWESAAGVIQILVNALTPQKPTVVVIAPQDLLAVVMENVTFFAATVLKLVSKEIFFN